jgi:hypothetical protein
MGPSRKPGKRPTDGRAESKNNKWHANGDGEHLYTNVHGDANGVVDIPAFS